MDRRDFLWTIGSMSSMALVGGVSSALDTKPQSAPAKKAVVSVGWLPKGETSVALFNQMIEKATDFSWLNKGGTVLVKLATNSGNPFPATTDPWGLDCLLKVLKEKGAGKIYVGDGSGVRFVYWNEKGQVRGTSRAFAQSTGLLPIIEKNGATPVFFEERGYGAYLETYPSGQHHWKQPLHVSNIVNEVDHIVYAPRLGSHALGDITSGIKIAVGFLREDSRRVFHTSGEDFYAMYEEINEVPAIKSKLRLVMTSGRSVMSLVGPDAGYVLEPPAGPVFASENLLAHEIFAYAFLQHAREHLTPKDASDPTMGDLWAIRKDAANRNRGFVKLVWGLPPDQVPALPAFQPGDIYKHPAIVNYIRLNQQNVKFSVVEVNKNPDHEAKEYIQHQLKV